MNTYEHEQFITGLRASIRRIVADAVEVLGSDLRGVSVVDLVLDQEPQIRSSADAKLALRIAGVHVWLSADQNARYRDDRFDDDSDTVRDRRTARALGRGNE